MAVTQDDRDEERDLQELFRQVAESDQEVDAYKLRNILQSQLREGSNTHALEIPASVCLHVKPDVFLFVCVFFIISNFAIRLHFVFLYQSIDQEIIYCN